MLSALSRAASGDCDTGWRLGRQGGATMWNDAHVHRDAFMKIDPVKKPTLPRLRGQAASSVWRTLIAGGALLAALTGCALPSLEGRSHSEALPLEQARDTAIGRAVDPLAQQHPGLSGIYPLFDPHDAYAARALLAFAAQKTLDVQYYIWRGDTTGTLMLGMLMQAAERGVRVRLLIDDNGITGLDDTLAAINAHPNIEVRLFNPFVLRWPKPLGFLTDFSRLNRRMHNKSFTVDNQVTIIGGRNVGDEYFGATQDILFADLDVMAIGAVVQEVSKDFDLYWASQSAYPINRLVKTESSQTLAAFQEQLQDAEVQPRAKKYQQILRESNLVSALVQGQLDFQWARTTMISDDPAKALGPVSPEKLLVWQMDELLGKPAHQVDLVSSYFVPTAAGVRAFEGLMQRPGMQIRVLTNSLAATDVTAVHAGYAKRRRALLEAGVQLFELRPTMDKPTRHGSGPFGSSGSALHAKTFAVDGKRLFVGSFNFDPRSVNLNTELGFIIESPEMAQALSRSFEQVLPYRSYRVELDDKGELVWIQLNEDGTQRRFTSEPDASIWRRAGVGVLSVLPIEWLL